MIGSDLDGVIAKSILNRADYRPFRLHQFYAQCRPGPLCRAYFDVIITGRRIHYQKVTKRWLAENGVKYDKLVMYPNKIKKNNRSSAQYKAKVINELGVAKYYEDDVRIADYLIKNCSNTKIVLVGYNK
jgi:hypothetical protein